MDTLVVMQHNVLSWTFNRRRELCNHYLGACPHIILLNSTSVINSSPIKVAGYNVHTKNCTNEAQAGIAIAVRKNIPHKLLDDFADDLLAVEIETVRGPIIVATTYVPPRWAAMPTHDILRIMRKPIPCYLLGDLNARHVSMGHTTNNARGNELATLLNRNLLTFIGPDFPTLLTGRMTGKPDIILTNRHHHFNTLIQPGPLTSSDHLPVLFKLTTRPIIIPATVHPNYSEADWDLFKDTLIQTLGNDYQEPPVLDKNYIDQKITFWYNAIANAKSVAIPNKERKLLPSPKTTPYLLQIQNNYSIFKRLAQHFGYTENLRRLITRLRLQLKAESSKLFNDFWSRKLLKIQDDYGCHQLFWNQVKKLLGGDNSFCPYIIENNVKYYTAPEKELIFREKWQNIFRINDVDNQHFDRNQENIVLDYLRLHPQDILPYPTVDINRLDPEDPIMRPTTPREIKRIISNFKNKAPGESQVNRILLSKLPDCMYDFFSELTNETISMGYFPNFYKIGLLHFIVKTGKSLLSVNNYRPISLLEVPGKIIERVLLSRLNKFLFDNNLINSNQYGFIPGRGTQTALAQVYEIISISQSKGQGCNVVSRDISKAFDKVWHQGLKYKMCTANFPNLLLRVLCSFLDDRFAKIKINNFLGPIFPLLSGVPQGAVLSPTLFNFYTHDIPPPSIGCYQLLFADDHTQIITTYSKKSKRDLALKTSREIRKINQYEQKWKITTNQNKFQLISISATKPFNVIVNNQIIPFNRTCKILGFTFSGRGFKPHIQQRLILARTNLQKLRRFKGLSTKAYLYLYKSLIRPILEYPAVLLSLTKKTNLSKLQAVQNKALRRAYGDTPPYRSTIRELHMFKKLEPLNVRFHRLGNKTWKRLIEIDNSIPEKSVRLNNRRVSQHSWWRRLSSHLLAPPPRPKFIK